MPAYRITSAHSGAYYGTFEAESPDAALETMWAESGGDYYDTDGAVTLDPDAWVVEEINESSTIDPMTAWFRDPVTGVEFLTWID